ncbi:MAG: hypothetical protein M3Q23_16655 [Actinomycetota bacterium]|nr:hypothetical protein [Actinomycetota bacterium]
MDVDLLWELLLGAEEDYAEAIAREDWIDAERCAELAQVLDHLVTSSKGLGPGSG